MSQTRQQEVSRIGRLCACCALFSLVATFPLLAGVSVDESRVLDRWKLRIGGYSTGLSTELRLDSSIEDLGTTISLEDDLGFKSSETVPTLSLGYIIGKRHQISATYFENKRDNTTTITEEIEWGEETFPIDAEVGAFYDTTFFVFSYTYFFYTSETTALGATFGLVWTSVSGGIGISLLGAEIDLSEDLSTDVPIPQLGFSVSQWLGRRFVLNAGVGYIGIDIEDVSGNAAGIGVSVEHRTWKNFGFGLGYAYSGYDVDAESTDFLGRFDYRISGFEFYGRAGW